MPAASDSVRSDILAVRHFVRAAPRNRCTHRHECAAVWGDDHPLEVHPVPDLLEQRQQDVVDDEEAVLGVVDDVHNSSGWSRRLSVWTMPPTAGTAK